MREIDLARRVDEMGRQLETLRFKSTYPLDREFSIDPPFSPQIMNEVIPPKFKMPHIDPYGGTTDPFDHLESFKALMLLHGAIDGILCKAFPTTLRKVVRFWFAGLHPASIHSFEQLG